MSRSERVPFCQELLICANFEVSPALESKLHEYVMLLEQAHAGGI